MAFLRGAGLLISLSMFVPSFGAASQSRELTVPHADRSRLRVEVNGRPLMLRVDPGIAGIVLNPEVAAAIGLTPSRSRPQAVAGPVRLQGRSASAQLRIGKWQGKRTFLWFDKEAAAGAAGIIGVAQLPHETVRLELRPPSLGEKRIDLPVQGRSGSNLLHRRTLNGREIAFLVSPWRANSQATASAGAHLATYHGGVWSGELSLQQVLLNIERPVRQMTFTTPVSLDGLVLNPLLVRTADHRGNYVLPSDASADPDEIVVTGQSKYPANLAVIVGNDALSRCSSITYRRKAKRLSIQCKL